MLSQTILPAPLRPSLTSSRAEGTVASFTWRLLGVAAATPGLALVPETSARLLACSVALTVECAMQATRGDSFMLHVDVKSMEPTSKWLHRGAAMEARIL